MLRDHGIDLTADYTGAEDAAEWLDGRETGWLAATTQADGSDEAHPPSEPLAE